MVTSANIHMISVIKGHHMTEKVLKVKVESPQQEIKEKERANSQEEQKEKERKASPREDYILPKNARQEKLHGIASMMAHNQPGQKQIGSMMVRNRHGRKQVGT